MPAALGTQVEMFRLAQQHHAAVGLGEQTQQVVQQTTQQRLHLQRAAQVLGNLQDHLQLVSGVLTEERMVGRRGADLARMI